MRTTLAEHPMVKRWQPTPQEIDLIADMLDANRPKAAIAKFRVRFGKHLAALAGQGAGAAPRCGVALGRPLG